MNKYLKLFYLSIFCFYSKKKISIACFILVTITLILLFELKYENTNQIKYSMSFAPIFFNNKLTKPTKPKPKQIFCFVITQENSLKTKAKLMYESWVNKCDNHVFISTIPNDFQIQNINTSNQAFEILFESNMKLLRPENYTDDKYNKLTDKIYLTLIHLYKHYHDYEYYLKADDDTYIIMNNLRSFLKKQNTSSVPLTYGYNYKTFVDKGYHSGGAGYVLTNNAFKKLGEKLSTNYKFCPNSGTEDIDIAKCARLLNIQPAKSTDHLGRERFHPFNPTRHYKGSFSSPYDWIYWMAENPIRKGLDCCSDETISFHYMYDKDVKKLDQILKKYFNKIKNGSVIFKQVIEDYLL